MQSELTNIINKGDVGLYRDDGQNLKQKGKKAIAKVFKNCGLSTVVDTN